MAQSEIDSVRALLTSKPRPVGWPERRKRLDEIGSVWPVADDVKLASVDVSGLPGEWSIAQLRDAHVELPPCAWLVSPWTDLTLSGSTLTTKDAVDPIIHKAYLNELVDAYLPAGMERNDPRVSPLFADLKEFPPMLIQVGSAETLLDDATRFARIAAAADVAVTLEIWPHMIHAWPLWNAQLEPGRRALASVGAFVRSHVFAERVSSG